MTWNVDKCPYQLWVRGMNYIYIYIHIYISLRIFPITIYCTDGSLYWYTLLSKKVVTPPLKTIKPMWIELLYFHLAGIGMIWTRDCSPTNSNVFLIVRTMPRPTPMGVRHEVFALAREALSEVLLLPCGFDSCYRQPHTQKACCHWIFGARQVFRGSSKDNTSLRPCIAEEGPTGSFLECSGLDGADEKSVRNEGWSHNG